MRELARQLEANHVRNTGCLHTRYERISGLRVKASTTNGTSGIGVWRGSRVYWCRENDGSFTVTREEMR